MKNQTIQEQKKEIKEEERIYIFQNKMNPGSALITRFFDVVDVEENTDGSHRVYTADGKNHYVAPDFTSIHAIPYEQKASA